jgi:hypothetical protein
MKQLFPPLVARVLFASLAAAAPAAIAARDNGSQSAQEGSGGGRSCVRVMGRLVCKGDSASSATAATATVAPAVLAARLFAEGPSLSPGNDARTFAIQGFVRSGWPVAVDFQPQPGTVTVLTVTPYGAPPSGSPARLIRDAAGRFLPPPGGLRMVIDPTGRSGRRLFIGRLDIAPAQGGDRPLAIATYTVESYRLGAKGKPSLKRAPVEIFGFGAGHEAVGAPLAARAPWRRAAAALAAAPAQSVAAAMSLTQVVLAGGAATLPLPRRPAGAAVGYAYNMRRSFHLVAEDIWRVCNGRVCQLAFSRRLPNPTPLGPQTGRWTLLPTNSKGPYRLIVRAWQQCRSPDFTLCANQAAFSHGQSAAVGVR